ncbi:MAG: hypothetical protein AAF725_23355, partial [Acidobacteriota bacterium]
GRPEAGKRAAAVLVDFESPENVRLALERGGRTVAWREGRRGTLWLPIAPDESSGLELRLESLDRRGNAARLTASRASVRRWSEEELARGVAAGGGNPEAGGGLALLALDLDRPGCWIADRDVEIAPSFALSAAASSGPQAVEAGALFAASGETLFLASRGARRVSLRRAVLEPGKGARRLIVPAWGAARCDLAASAEPLLIQASSLAGRISLDLGDRPTHQAARGSVTLTASLGGVGESGSRAMLGVRAEASSALAEIDLEIAAHPAAPGSSPREAGEAPAVGGAREFEVGPGESLEIAVAPSWMRLNLSAGLVASVGGERLFWARGEGLSVETRLSGAGVVVIDEGGRGGRLTLEPLGSGASPEGAASLAPGVVVERRMAGRGVFDLRLSAGAGEPGGFLHVTGARATLYGGDGSLATGSPLALPAAGGGLRLEHDAGLVRAWITPGPGPAGGFPWRADPEPLRPPASLLLDGSERAFALDLERPAVLSMRAPSPAAVRVERAGSGASGAAFGVHPESLSLEVALPAGRSVVRLAEIAGAGLGGRLEARLQFPETLGEGLGEGVLLGPGETRFFRVEIPSPRRVGLGVRAEADVVNARLLEAASGAILGSGVVQSHRLKAGSYLFAVELGESQAPVRVRPALVGLERPSSGPPRDLVEDYLRLAAEGAR